MSESAITYIYYIVRNNNMKTINLRLLRAFCTNKDNLIKIRRKLSDLDINKVLKTPLPRDEVRNPLFEVKVSNAALKMIYFNQRLATGSLQLTAAIVWYCWGAFWAFAPAMLGLIQFLEYRTRRNYVEEGVRRIMLINKDLI